MAPSFTDFLRELHARLSEPGKPLFAGIRFDPTIRAAGPQELLVGVGYWTQGDAPVEHQGICLNNKGFRDRPGSAFRSVTEMVRHCKAATVAGWKAKTGLQVLREGLPKWRVVGEDASVDSVAGVLLFLARVCGVDPTQIPSDWVRYVGDWELGHVRAMGEPINAWGVLHSSLAHGVAGVAHLGDMDAAQREAAFTEAWYACLRLLCHVLLEEVSPFDLARARPSLELARARALLRAEVQDYELSLRRGTLVQLYLPVTDVRRRVLVDAYIGEHMGGGPPNKALLRTDTVHPWGGDGFGFAAIHNPTLQGTGNDMVISVDPELSLTLKELWGRLEARENDRWGDERPSSSPRRIASYPKGEGYDQPWWDDHGDYTLVAAPKRLPDAKPGTRLNWSDVLDEIWAAYSPAKGLTLRTDAGTSVELNCLAGRLLGNTRDGAVPGKRLIVGHWDPEAKFDAVLLQCPTVHQVMAALVGGDSEPSLRSLPPSTSFEVVQLTGGFAVVAEQGVFLFDDWQTATLTTDILAQEFERTAKLVCTVLGAAARLGDLTRNAADLIHLAGTQSGGSVLDELAQLKAEVREAQAESHMLGAAPERQLFRATLERWWGIEAQLERLYVDVERTQESVRAHSEVRANKLIWMLTVYGFPVALFGAYFEVFFGDISKGNSFHMVSLLVYVLLCIVGVVGLRWFAGRTQSR